MLMYTSTLEVGIPIMLSIIVSQIDAIFDRQITNP